METLPNTPQQAVVSIAENQNYIIDVAPFADILNSDAGTDPANHQRNFVEAMDALVLGFNGKDGLTNIDDLKNSYHFLKIWRDAVAKMIWKKVS